MVESYRFDNSFFALNANASEREASVKNKLDSLFLHTAICDEASQSCSYATKKSPARISLSGSYANALERRRNGKLL